MTDTILGHFPRTFNIEELIRHALLSEVSATPKPGLVDRHDSGAHKDMCYDTFVASTHAITPYLVQMFDIGCKWNGGPDKDAAGLFAAIRPIGVEAEKAMFAATHGVNTHKGMIFSMGIVAASAGLSYRSTSRFDPEHILGLAGAMCHDMLEDDFRKIDRNNPKTHGEILYVRYGMRGIRGEAQEGFPSIRHISLPAIGHWKGLGLEDNQVFINTLLSLMSQVDDTNVLIRTSPELLAYEKQEAARILELGGAGTLEGMDALKQLNEDFIRLNISPGGCADLLAVTVFLTSLEAADPKA